MKTTTATATCPRCGRSGPPCRDTPNGWYYHRDGLQVDYERLLELNPPSPPRPEVLKAAKRFERDVTAAASAAADALGAFDQATAAWEEALQQERAFTQSTRRTLLGMVSGTLLGATTKEGARLQELKEATQAAWEARQDAGTALSRARVKLGEALRRRSLAMQAAEYRATAQVRADD